MRRNANAAAPVLFELDTEGQPAQQHALRERAPGHFESRWLASPSDEVRVVVEVGEGAALQSKRLVSSKLADVAAEHQVDPTTALDLDAFSRVTGGNDVLAAGGLSGFVPRSASGTAPVALTRLWPWFILFALAIYLIEIYYRRSGLRRGV